jgi:eukaryotic-like serine/threonine-protein kinase
MDRAVCTPAVPGMIIAGRYELDRCVGSGGSCDVWSARDGVDGRDVAVKLTRDLDPAAASVSLIVEARAAARVRHRNVVAVVDCGIDEARPFLAMELTDGRTLRDRLREGPLAVTELVRLAGDLLDALGAVHDAGLAHGDVKPMNLLRDAGGGWKLADFGAACPLAPVYGVSSLETTVVGTPGYLAPERLAGRTASIASDLYAAAVTLHEAATGVRPSPPTEVSTSPEVAPPIVQVGRRSPARHAFLEALSPCLDADPTIRPTSAPALAASLDLAVRSAYGPDQVRPGFGSNRARRVRLAHSAGPRRGRQKVAAAALMAVTAIVGVGWVGSGDPGGTDVAVPLVEPRDGPEIAIPGS